MDRLSAEDRIMLVGDDTWPQDIGGLAILDGRSLFAADGHLQLEMIRRAVAGRLHLLPRFRHVLYQPRRGLGGPLWVDAPTFSLDDHIRVAAVPAPGGEEELLQTVERLRRQRLDPSRPLWQMWLLTGLPDTRIGLYVRVHHVIADGMAGVVTLATLLDASPEITIEPPRPWTPQPAPSAAELLADNLRRHVQGVKRGLTALAHPRATVRRVATAGPTIRWMLTAKPGPPTSLDRVVGPDRALAVVRTDLDAVRQIAHAHGATVNDVLLAVTAGGLRDLLQHRGEAVAELTLPIYVPHSLRRESSDESAGNLVSQMVVPIPLGETDPGRRLRQIATETTRRKAAARPSVGSLFPSWIPGRVIMRFIGSRRVNLTSTNLPGPQTPLYFVGAHLLEIFPVLPIIGNITLGIGAMSHAGQFNLMIVADREAYPDLQVFAEGATRELDALSSTTTDPAASPMCRSNHIDLLDRPLCGVLTTEMPNGRLQATVVWYERDGDGVALSTMREFQKARNLLARPRASLLVMEPGLSGRWMEMRGPVAVVDEDTMQRLDGLGRRYTGHAPYFGAVVPAALAASEHPVTYRLTPTAVSVGPRLLPPPPPLRSESLGMPEPPNCEGEPALPSSHLDLLDRPLLAALATRLPSGLPHTQPVWFERDGNHILLNTTCDRRKGRNLLEDPRATILVVDPEDASRWIEIRGDAELTSVGARTQLDRLTRRYTGAGPYYGHVYPRERQAQEVRLLVRLHPRRINCDAVHREPVTPTAALGNT